MIRKSIFYAIQNEYGEYLQGIDVNENYKRGAVSPTMGVCHSYCEYRTVWGNKEKFFEPITMANYVKILCEEFRWDSREMFSFAIHPQRRKSIDER